MLLVYGIVNLGVIRAEDGTLHLVLFIHAAIKYMTEICLCGGRG